MSQQGYQIEDLTVGQTAELSKTVTSADIVMFAEVTGDTNPVHMDEEFASATMFKGRIAHGMLSAGFISAVLGAHMPGPGAIYISQTMKFKAPVRIGDTVTARCTVTKIDTTRRRVTLDTTCLVGDKVVVDGEASLMIPA